MIVDTIKNRNIYSAISPRIKKGLEYLANTDFSKMEPGRYELDGSNLLLLSRLMIHCPGNRVNGNVIATMLIYST